MSRYSNLQDPIGNALQNRMPGYRVKIGFGLHVGWAIEGAIGSSRKIDATYLSPHVNLASRLEAATKQYVLCILLLSARTFSHHTTPPSPPPPPAPHSETDTEPTSSSREKCTRSSARGQRLGADRSMRAWSKEGQYLTTTRHSCFDVLKSE